VGERPNKPIELLSQLNKALIFNQTFERIAFQCVDVLLVSVDKILDPVSVFEFEYLVRKFVEVRRNEFLIDNSLLRNSVLLNCLLEIHLRGVWLGHWKSCCYLVDFLMCRCCEFQACIECLFRRNHLLWYFMGSVGELNRLLLLFALFELDLVGACLKS